MRTLFRVLSYVVAALVMVQAASFAWATAGLGRYVAEGGVFDSSLLEDTGDAPPFPEVIGVLVHGLNGMYLIPAVGIVLVVVSLFAKVSRGTPFALLVLALIALQVTLGLVATGGFPLSALFHGLNAMLLFAVALHAATRPPTLVPTEDLRTPARSDARA